MCGLSLSVRGTIIKTILQQQQQHEKKRKRNLFQISVVISLQNKIKIPFKHSLFSMQLRVAQQEKDFDSNLFQFY